MRSEADERVLVIAPLRPKRLRQILTPEGELWMGRRRRYERTPKPPCPRCNSDQSKVIDSDVPYVIAPPGIFTRQRECLNEACRHRFYTYESTICGSDLRA